MSWTPQVGDRVEVPPGCLGRIDEIVDGRAWVIQEDGGYSDFYGAADMTLIETAPARCPDDGTPLDPTDPGVQWECPYCGYRVPDSGDHVDADE